MTRRRLLREVDTVEWAGWTALYDLEHEEREREARKAKAKRGRR